jgi:oligopeptidase B
MKAYSPVDNVQAKAYPSMLVTAGLHDPRVAYWEPLKWVSRLRALKTDTNPLLLKTDLSSGHFSASDRYKYIRESAFEYAFIASQLEEGDKESQA